MAAVDTIFEQLGQMSVLELVELKNKIEEEWGITAAAPVAVAAGPAAGGSSASPAGGSAASVSVGSASPCSFSWSMRASISPTRFVSGAAMRPDIV